MTIGSQVKNCFSTIKHIEAELYNLEIHAQTKDEQHVFSLTQQMMTQIKINLQDQIDHLVSEEPQY